MIEERHFQGYGGRGLFYRFCPAASGSARGAIVIIHGFGEHSGRYLETMERFAQHGFSSWTMDVRGYGRSAKIIADMESVSAVSEDIRIMTAIVRKELGDLPLVLLGHSLGGLLAINQLILHQSDYDLAITSGPGILPPANASGFLVMVAGLIARIAPRLALSPLEQDTTTRDEEMLARDRIDPLYYQGGFRARSAYELLRMQLFVRDRLASISIPLLALHGGDDRIMDPQATEIVYSSISSTDKTKHVFPGLYHEVLNEPERDEVFGVIFGWLDPRVAKRA